jgi:hypothetical protein
MTISIGRTAIITRGKPAGMHRRVGSAATPSSASFLRLASKIAWYSGVNGACCAAPGGLLGSQDELRLPPSCCHGPRQLGYFDSSNACAAVNVADNTAAAASDPREPRQSMRVLLRPGHKFAPVMWIT